MYFQYVAGSDYVEVSQDFTFSPGTNALSDTIIITENIDVLQDTETLQLLLSTTDQGVTTGGPATVNIVDTGMYSWNTYSYVTFKLATTYRLKHFTVVCPEESV